ncbi:MgtC/SapB family protein [Cupriavidus lacunae]|uniref:Protein MgtC n=1 Tax=Cupriavidus lacunae TaxID=2666307 RepID=A0A370NY50_9BURK|nr:MgtC/SapB family protein [Cupriavidus lacunae]RDK10556.1 MgtC/SapB family protein [Cupriavidus lacunae]
METFSLDLVLRLLAGLLAGALIGLDRNLRGKAAGMRTLGLVSLGAATAACLVTLGGHPPDALSRVLQGVLTGVGFLGVGVIARHGVRERPQGLTTAAAIWLAAVLGAASGAGYYMVTGTALVLGMALLWVGGRFEVTLHRFLEGNNGGKHHGEPHRPDGNGSDNGQVQ